MRVRSEQSHWSWDPPRLETRSLWRLWIMPSSFWISHTTGSSDSKERTRMKRTRSSRTKTILAMHAKQCSLVSEVSYQPRLSMSSIRTLIHSSRPLFLRWCKANHSPSNSLRTSSISLTSTPVGTSQLIRRLMRACKAPSNFLWIFRPKQRRQRHRTSKTNSSRKHLDNLNSR